MSTITREWLQQTIAEYEANRDELPFGLDTNSAIELQAFKLALASLEAEPIYQWRPIYEGEDSWNDCTKAQYGEFAQAPDCELRILYTATPAPVSVPDAMEMDDDFDSAFEHGKAVGWNAYRAAMLQGAEPVTTDYKLPFDQWLSQQTGTIDVECGCVMTEVFFHWLRVAYDAGNSPVIPDWQTKAEKLAELHGSSFVVFRNGGHPQCADPSKVIISFTDEGLGHGAAAPQQEVK
ncbi:hypothetical protein DP531_09295 [Salmonella enterica]|nr:hypothetical protein [Salmonella enterica subsp. enterica serovar Cerro]EAQ7481218.1 hypothetical protein [Salmonella enterica]EBI4348472.1 hypothetical protein [Salmonella enterica subsp. enterica serovar Cerro]EBN3172973.1 hypothetical protein [Salmonella enterica]ECT4745859.1 hypothetical protein [Salmonella enterica subsp. enterica serovar Cerro]